MMLHPRDRRDGTLRSHKTLVEILIGQTMVYNLTTYTLTVKFFLTVQSSSNNSIQEHFHGQGMAKAHLELRL